MSSRYRYNKCNVTSWTDQLSAFKAAASLSPRGIIDIVIANAGVTGADWLMQKGSTI